MNMTRRMWLAMAAAAAAVGLIPRAAPRPKKKLPRWLGHT